ncbi:3-hydroxyisobutyrate dehydrogenase-like beta-hydroxyacid dehydrogenase [Streptomyces sp. 1114.5]|uniref:NAD(P)-dependent oxidoreductase n=1 Tax=unclassified Streptomyces TaxID=2593676 RepID=UPI000BDD982C|nr:MULTISPECIES: NAD(P)-binding domain-containing protein [unclassified Streptomyces]RKT16601.1 3-hydroxyisobutyrate dehydrogenase-like beta-hydroxyacid dehydrogenase [Streptomyces sp. 1114.5]SOB82763.1 3-hydroxyisobutyrate dehydrogenase [Streptomyces sp. 1331.2]
MTNKLVESASKTPLTPLTPLTLLGLGAMGTALAEAWLTAGHPLTVWNRTAARADALAVRGAVVAPTVAEAVAANRLVVVCLLDDASVEEALAGVDLTGKDLVNLVTSTPGQARARAAWAERCGARYLDGGIMAVPPMIGVPAAGPYVFYSGSTELFEEHRAALAAPADTRYVGEDAGYAALHDVALLSAMYGMLAGVAHAFALVRGEAVAPGDLAPMLSDYVTAMSQTIPVTAEQLESGDYTKGVVSNLAMQVAGKRTLLGTAEEQGVSAELLEPYFRLMERRLEVGSGEEDLAGVVDLLRR